MIQNMNLLKQQLRQHSGGSGLYYHSLTPRCNYTIGMKDYFTKAECWWLHDILATEFHNALVKNKVNDSYYVTIRVADAKAIVSMENYCDEIIYTRTVDFTTHPTGEFEFVMAWDGKRSILCLHNEN